MTILSTLLFSLAGCAATNSKGAKSHQMVPDRSPAGLTNQPVQVHNGRPTLVANGHIVTSIYCDRFPWGGGRWHVRNADFAARGVDMFHLTLRGDQGDFYTTALWPDDGVFNNDETSRNDNSSLLDQARSILDANPDTSFTIHFFTAPPKGFAEKYPGHIQQGEDNKMYRAGSYGSEKYVADQLRMIRQLVKYVDASKIADRVVGYTIIPQSEGVTEASIGGDAFDQSPAMQERFTDYLRKKYKTDAVLQAAWQDETASLANNSVPTMAGWHDHRSGWLTFTTKAQTQRYRDFFALQRELLHSFVERSTAAIKETSAKPVAVTVDAFKQPMSGWMINDAFAAKGDGMDFPDILLASGSYDVARSLDIETLDGLMTPADYTARSVGLGFGPEGLSDSLTLRGKLMLLEDDARSWINEGFRNEQGAWRDPQEAIAGLRRNLAVAASCGMLPHWANVSRGYFDDPKVMAIVSDLLPLRDRLFTMPLHQTEHAVALIIDDEAGLYTDFTSGFFQLAVLRQRVDQLSLMGIPFRVYLFSDLKRADFPTFRTYLFPNLLRLNDERVALLNEKVLRDGSLAIFGPATGITDGETLSADGANKLLGLDLELIEKKAARRVLVHADSHPALAHAGAVSVFGDSYQFGPLLLPKYERPSDVVELGKASVFWGSNTSGLVLREVGKGAAGNGKPGSRGNGDYAVVFSAAVPMPTEVVRSLAIYGGCNAWSDAGDVVMTDGKMLAIHSVRSGERTIRLPEPATVVDIDTGQVIVTNTDTFTLTLDAPATRIMRLQ